MDGRLYSQEQMANWRLQIWQDTVRDLFWNARYYQDELTYGLVRDQGSLRNDLTYLFGFGYNEILPSMNHWERQGTDGSNQKSSLIFAYLCTRTGRVSFRFSCNFVQYFITCILVQKIQKLLNLVVCFTNFICRIFRCSS